MNSQLKRYLACGPEESRKKELLLLGGGMCHPLAYGCVPQPRSSLNPLCLEFMDVPLHRHG